jgi:S-disulfanyl-L-cysteine oxidoreductase SoxD
MPGAPNPESPPQPAVATGGGSLPARLGIGRPATEAEIDRLDIDVRPDGTGLPQGSGSVRAGRELYAARCAACHGTTGKEGPNDRLVGRFPGDSFPFGTDPTARRTIGSYWPYATTLFDYIRRAMPFDAPGSLTSEQIYSVAAWLLFANDLIPEDAVLDAKSLPAIRMPARLRFVPDNRRGGREVR